ncbi:hypothetical protein FEK31_25040, partial [Nocardia cyriacigeorgica]
MDVYSLPDLVTTQDLEELLGVKRAMISRLRKDPGFPELVAESTPRKPLYLRRDVLRWLVASGRAPAAALPAFDPPPGDGPITQRWFRDRAEFVKVPAGWGGLTEVHVTRYTAGEYSDERTLSLVVPVGDPGPAPITVRGQTLRPDVIAALGYGRGHLGLRGAIAVIRPHDWPLYDHGDLFGAEIPDTIDGPVRLNLLDAAVVSQLIGHLLPYWEEGAVAKTAAALWEPRPLGQHIPPVPATHAPPGLADAAALRRQCREVIDQITSGRRPAPDGIVDELAQLGNTMWDTTLSSRFHWGYDTAIEVPAGWVLPIEPPRPTATDPNPVLPRQPGEVNLFHALEWLIGQPDLPVGMARTATGFYGYPTSVDVLTVDCRALPQQVQAVIDRHLTAIRADDTWLHQALAEALEQHRDDHLESGEDQQPAAAGDEQGALGWVTDTDPQSHPARTLPGHRRGDLLAYHVPRAAFPIGAPAVVHLFVSTVGERRR